jgi:hypothetical protein
MIEIEHIQASVCANTGQRIDTLVCSYPRVIHSQLLTHRVFSKNSSSTRAIPLHKAIQQVRNNPAEYIWTENQAGMQGIVVNSQSSLAVMADRVFSMARESAIQFAEFLNAKPDEGGLAIHKQNAGRLLEPFQNIKIVLTATEWENWDWLRDDPAAQGEIAELARAISKARAEATPMVLNAGEWHVPFVDRMRDQKGNLLYLAEEQGELSAEEAQLVSMSVCAQTSYRNSNYSLEKALDMKGKLLDCEKKHASPSEHIATPIVKDDFEFVSGDIIPDSWPEGITHMDRNRNYWSGNFKGFTQYRQLLSGHDKAKS